MTAAPVALDVVCPAWCRVTQLEHLEQLSDPLCGGDVTHERDGMVRVVHTTRPDGSAYPDEPTPLIVVAEAYLGLEQAEATLADLRAAVELLRR
jgi:hypothetical protein